MMFTVRPSAPQSQLYSPLYAPTHRRTPSYPVYFDDSLEEDCSPFVRRRIDPEARYRQAVAEYLAAEQEYEAVIRAREEAAQRARAEAILREQARLRRAQIVRAQRERLQAIANARAEALAQHAAARQAQGSSLPRITFVIRGAPEEAQRTAPAPQMPQARATRPSAEQQQGQYGPRAQRTSVWEDFFESLYGKPSEPSSEAKQPEPKSAKPANAAAKGKARAVPEEGSKISIPSLEALVKERLQKVAGDDELQDVARAILRRLDQQAGVARPPSVASASASSSRVTLDNMGQSSEGADLYRSDALQGASAEAAKASLQAHRAGASGDASPRSSSSSLAVIRDIRAALAKLIADFSLPSSLDFSDSESDVLTYTPANAPVRAYEHALDKLLAQLDAVESDGDEEVRGRRREAVKEVEQAIEDVEKKVRRAREASKIDAEAPVEVEVLPEAEPSQEQAAAAVEEQAVSQGVVPTVPEAVEARCASSPSDADTVPPSLDAHPAVPGREIVSESTVEEAPSPATTPGEEALPVQGTLPASEATHTSADDPQPTVECAPQTSVGGLAPASPELSQKSSSDVTPESLVEAASSTPVPIPAAPTPASPVPATPAPSETFLTSLSSDHFSLPSKPKSRSSVVTVEDADDEDEWSELEV